jgi:hypothetical protein
MVIKMEQNQSNAASTRRERKPRWSAVDTLILLLVLAAIAGIVYRVVVTVTREAVAEQGTVCEVYFEVKEVHRDVLTEIQGFDPVYLYENDMRLGAIGATIDPATGEPVAAITVSTFEGTELANATGCMICRGTAEPNGALLVKGTGRYITRGSELMVRTDQVLLTIRVTDILIRE